jgi:tripartite-type tricarboxylate transporter receptor subunit TctC
MKTPRVVFVLAASLGLVGTVLAQNYPNRPVSIVVPFPAGGPTDNASHALWLSA